MFVEFQRPYKKGPVLIQLEQITNILESNQETKIHLCDGSFIIVSETYDQVVNKILDSVKSNPQTKGKK